MPNQINSNAKFKEVQEMAAKCLSLSHQLEEARDNLIANLEHTDLIGTDHMCTGAAVPQHVALRFREIWHEVTAWNLKKTADLAFRYYVESDWLVVSNKLSRIASVIDYTKGLGTAVDKITRIITED